MPWWWPFKEQKPAPIVQHIIESLESNPEAWSLHETEEIDCWVECNEDHPDAKKSETKRGKWNSWRSCYDPVYERPIMKYVFRLKYTGGTIIVVDHDATTYEGWVIEEPRHASITDFDSMKLSEAVKKWREHMVLHDLTLHTPERKLLEAAYEELEEDLGGGPKDQVG